jgi:antitoxin VapB
MGGPQLNIKDAEATRLVRELTELTGESQTEAVRKALRERLQREKAEREALDARTAEQKRREFEKVWAKIQKIQERVKKRRLVENMLTEDDLYDERGLPK